MYKRQLHVERYDDAFGAAARRVFGTSRDPLGPEEAALLHDYARHGTAPLAPVSYTHLEVHLRDAGGLKLGDIIAVEIEDADEHDLFGVPIGD